MRDTTFDEALALKLYREYKRDGEIGLAVGMTKAGIASWRRRHNLPSIAQTTHNAGTHYKKVLSSTQAKEMHSFLSTLTKGARLCKEAGVKPDVAAAMFAWDNVKMTAIEKTITQGFINRENQEKERA